MTSALRITGAAALLTAAAVHVAQLLSIFHAVAWIGPLFAADAVASTAIALALLTPSGRLASAAGRLGRLTTRGRPASAAGRLATRGRFVPAAGRLARLATPERLVPAAGALVSASALAGLVLSSTVGFLGWQEATLRPAIVISIAAELAAVGALAPLALPASRRGAGAWRAAAGVGLAAVAVLHIAAAGAEWADARYVFWLFMALAGVCFAVAVRLALGLDRWAPVIVLGLAAAPIGGYVLSRMTGFPGAADDIGDWSNPLGLAALAVEAGLIALTAPVAAARRSRSARPSEIPRGAQPAR